LKSDIDHLMAERGFDALVVTGPMTGNTALAYMTNGTKIGHGTLIKRRGEPAALLHGAMERDEAAKSGLEGLEYGELGYMELLKETGDPFQATLGMLVNALERLEVSGTVAFYGVGDPGRSYLLLKALSERLPDLTITGETDPNLFDVAYATKDAGEIAHMRRVAEDTNAVMGEVVDFVRGHAARDGGLARADGSPLTVGDVKRFARLRLLEHDLEDPEEMIFAVGRDAGVPHSLGEDADPLRLGQAIIFDLFPRELGGGYFHDMTRTFCLGFAPDEVQAAYDDVLACFEHVFGALEIGQEASKYQDMACDFFEARGHKTIRSDPNTHEGYVHSLGHGLGLQVHALPRLVGQGKDLLEPNQVFTVEPGLYYPERGFGVRVEDCVLARADGTFESLTPYPKDLVISVGSGSSV
jgi:Xaa-Pro aminopeptidase